MTSWIAPTAVAVGDIMAASEDALRVDDFQYLYDHRHDVLYVDRTKTALANSTTKTLVATYTVPAGMLGTAGILTMHGFMLSKCTSSNDNAVVVTLEYGGTEIGHAILTANNVSRFGPIQAWLVADGATNVQQGVLRVSGSVTATHGEQTDALASAGLAIDSSVAADIKLYLTNGRLNADASWAYYYFAVFGLP